MEGINTTVTATAHVPSTPSATFDDSLAAVLSALSGKKYTTKNLEKMKVTEDVLYASLVYDSLRTSSPATAKTFAKEIKERFDRRTKRNDSQPLAKAIDDILDNAVKNKKLSSGNAKNIIADSFGKAQLDSNRDALGRKARGDGINSIKEKIEKNSVASTKTAEKFEAAMEKAHFLQPSTARAQRAEFTKVLQSLKTAKPAQPPKVEPPKVEPPKVEVPKVPSLETDTAAPLPDAATEATRPNDFVYKPKSLKDSFAVVMLPLQYSKDVSQVEFIGKDGVLETLQHSGLGEDGRRYFRSSKPGDSLPSEVTIRLHFTNETDLDLPITDTRSTYKRSYTN